MKNKFLWFGTAIVIMIAILLMFRTNQLIPQKGLKSIRLYTTTQFKISKDNMIYEINDIDTMKQITKILNGAERMKGILDIISPQYILNFQYENSMDVFLWPGKENSGGIIMFPDASGIGYKINIESAKKLRELLNIKTY